MSKNSYETSIISLPSKINFFDAWQKKRLDILNISYVISKIIDQSLFIFSYVLTMQLSFMVKML